MKLGVLVSKAARHVLFGLLAALIPVVLIVPAVAGQSRSSSRSSPEEKLAQAADTTFREGIHAKLPPHISTLLGLSKEEECPVMQGVARTGTLVQGLDVSANNKKDIVFFVVDETANNQDLYLTSPEGTLRKVVSVKAGVGSEVRITNKEREAFKKEKQFWVDRLAPSAAAK